MAIVGVLIIVIVIAGVAGYYLMAPQAKMKDTLIIGTVLSGGNVHRPGESSRFLRLGNSPIIGLPAG